MTKVFARVSMLALALAATLMLSNAYTARAAANPQDATPAAAAAAPAVAALPAPAALAEPEAAPAPAAAPAFQDRDDKRAGREQHPHIRKAIAELREAKHELEIAPHDFGGHRADAVKECDEAIRQLQLALQYDKK